MRLPVKEHQIRFHPLLHSEELQREIMQQICGWQWVQVSIDSMDEQSQIKTVTAWELEYKSVSATITVDRFTALNVLVCVTLDDPDARRHSISLLLKSVERGLWAYKFTLVYGVA